MNVYINTGIFNATSMTRGKYNQTRGWDTPADENPKDRGYMVGYPDTGYTTWVPKVQFESTTMKLEGTAKLLPYQKRLIAERTQLDDRLSKLLDAMKRPAFAGIPIIERELLLSQSRAMTQYLLKLDKRMEYFVISQ